MSSEGEVALLCGGDVKDELLQEMLEHLGIEYVIVKEGALPSDRFSAVVVPRRTPELTALAARIAMKKESIVVAEEAVNLRGIFGLLSGTDTKYQDDLEPKVNVEEEKLAAAVATAMTSAGANLTRREVWPGGAKACCVLTHDVDWLTYSPFHWAVLSSGHGLRSLLGLLAGGLSGKNYGWNLDTIVNLEKEHGFRSTFFLMTEYGSGEERLAEGAALLKASGCEISLHGSMKSHLDKSALAMELHTLEKKTGVKAKGVRHHILKFEVSETWKIAGQEDLLYDSTYSRNRAFGFRPQLCYPYHPFSEGRRLNLVELPAAFMDFTALSRGLRGEKAFEFLERITSTVEMYHGVLVVNFHNTYLNRKTFPDVFSLYTKLLKLIKDGGYWVATAEECTEWWNRRGGTLNRSATKIENFPRQGAG
jgi:peptidoglycan/xylan/chitin deacetylase (PgdA/CDA1 family)